MNSNSLRKSLTRLALVGILCIVPIAALYGRRLERGYPNLSYEVPCIAFLLFVFHAFTESLRIARIRPREIQHYRIVAAFCAAPVILLFLSNMLVDFPIERIHLLKYGLLSSLVFACQSSGSIGKRFLVAFLLTAAIGIGEETSQLWIPERRFDLRDILLNVSSALFGSAYAALASFARRTAWTTLAQPSE